MFTIFFPLKSPQANGTLERVTDPKDIDQKASQAVLVDSFIGEYQKYLMPNEVSQGSNSWREGEKSVQKYYEDYFQTEFNEFTQGILHYWVQAKLEGKLVGWATFQRETAERNAIYMNLLVVRPEYQARGIGEQLVKALMTLQELPELRAIHILLRKKNQGGRAFYSKLGFKSNPEYTRADNFVDMNLLEPFSWKNPAFENKADLQLSIKADGKSTLFNVATRASTEEKAKDETYCGFKPGFLIGQSLS